MPPAVIALASTRPLYHGYQDSPPRARRLTYADVASSRCRHVAVTTVVAVLSVAMPSSVDMHAAVAPVCPTYATVAPGAAARNRTVATAAAVAHVTIVAASVAATAITADAMVVVVVAAKV